jgi:membrane-bound lytic murein transglycosylase B
VRTPPATAKEKTLLKRTLTGLLGGLLTALLPLSGHAQQSAAFSEQAGVQAFIVDMHAQHGFDISELTSQFASIHANPTVLRLIRPPAHPSKQRSWQSYRQRFVNGPREAGGLRFWEENGALLQRAEAIYGVPAEIIVAIIGVETSYGQNTGSFSVLEALASLAFDYPPRAEFFRSELENFLLLARENGDDPLAIQGSYAGAMGIPQFMPSSQRNYAVDFDGDGRVDLRHSTADAIGSVARYLQKYGWQKGAPVAVPARVDGDPAALLAAGIKPALTVQELSARGVFMVRPGSDDTQRTAALIDLETPGRQTEYWLGFENFYVITRYNRSSFYAMSVFQLAEVVREVRHNRLAATR